MFERETWRFINSFAPWLSALGTLTAVVVSLYLARRASRLDLRVFPAIVRLFSEGAPASPEYFQVRVVNHGREAVVKGIEWSLLGTRGRWIVLPPDDPYSTKLPAKLDFGEEALLLFPTATFDRLGKSLLDEIRGSTFPRFTVRRLRVGVYASTGQRSRVALDRHLRRFLLERSREVSTGEDDASAEADARR